MYRGYIYGRDLCMTGSPYALLAFKREFGESLPDIVKHIQRRFAETDEIDIISLLGVCWAMCKSHADYGTPCFAQWLADFDDADIDNVDEAVMAFDQIWSALEAELMVTSRPLPPEPAKEGAGGDAADAETDDLADWIEWRNILALLNLGFSMDDIKHMPMCDFIAYTDLMAHEYEEQKKEQEPQVIEADQAIIDSFFF